MDGRRNGRTAGLKAELVINMLAILHSEIILKFIRIFILLLHAFAQL